MNPMLDDIELPQVQAITTYERRVLAEHKPLAMAGSLLQNMGRRPTRLGLWGVAMGPDALNLIEKLDGRFRDGKAVPFTADIVADAEIDKVVIEDLRLRDLAGRPECFSYVLTLREFIEPVEPEDASALDANILDEGRNLIDDIVPGLDIGLNFATGLERFVAPLSELLTRLQETNKGVNR